MKLYTKKETEAIKEHIFSFILLDEQDHVLTITLNRESKKNALHPQMVNEIAFAMHYAHFSADIWAIVIAAKGNIFCAGADLKAMQGIIEPNDSTVPAPSGDVLIAELFQQVHKPTIAKVTGDVYAGGFFFLAGCNIVVAQQGVKFGLPEVKRGLYPFQVMAALMKVMPERKVIDWCIRGYRMEVDEAMRYGLVTEVADSGGMDAAVDGIVAELKQNSPSAIYYGLEAYDHLYGAASDQQYLYDMLQKTIKTPDGAEGLTAFREKRKPQWKGLS